MTDKLSTALRSANMKAIRGRDTGPEMCVRKVIFALGYRYRLHVRGLPGTPDLVFSSRRQVIFVHGCFWHQHEGCKRATIPQSNVDFWRDKLERNVCRDAENVRALNAAGWRTLVIWECETKDAASLKNALLRFLGALRKL